MNPMQMFQAATEVLEMLQAIMKEIKDLKAVLDKKEPSEPISTEPKPRKRKMKVETPE